MNQTFQPENITQKVNLTSIHRSNFVYYSFVAYYILLSCGAVLNFSVVFVILRSGKIRQNISSFLIFHLSVTHLLLHLTVPILWYIHASKGNSSSCKVLIFLDLACAASIFNSLAAIAWDRHRNVLRPFTSLVPRYLKTYLVLVAAIWTYAFVTSVPFIYSVRTGFQVICTRVNSDTETCKKYSFCHLPSDWKTQLFKTTYFLLAFAIPLMFVVIAYAKIAVSLWKRSKNGTIHSAVAKSKVKSTRLMVVAVLGFFLCWGPKFFVDLLNVYGVHNEHYFVTQNCTLLAQMSSSSVNPLIYAFLSPEFRKLFFKFCCCCCSRRVFSSFRRRCGANRVQPII